MSKAPSPLLGYNNNVRHKNKVFHIQTEDSGVKYGHIITHLFMDGGRILKSIKTSYSEYLGNERMAEIVREMMKQQHKAMFLALRDGHFDEVVDGKPPAPTAAPAPVQAEAPGLAPDNVPSKSPSASAKSAIDETAGKRGEGGKSPPSADVDPAHAKGSVPAPATVRTPPSQELTLDIEALERAAEVAEQVAFKSTSELPPPPSNLFREKTATGQYRAVIPPADPPRRARPASAPPPPEKRPSRPPARGSNRPARLAPLRAIPPTTTLAATKKGAPAPQGSNALPPPPLPVPPPSNAERRYAPTRPASIFGQARPQQGKTIFGEDLISDKSLDEVILSYLADDLEPQGEKK